MYGYEISDEILKHHGVKGVYRAVDNNTDKLQHWKYIKRYKNSSGKWTYVYADKKTHNKLKYNDETTDYRAMKARGPQGTVDNQTGWLLKTWYNDSLEEYQHRRALLGEKGREEFVSPGQRKIRDASKELGKAYSDIRKAHEYRERTLKQRDVKYLINKTLTKTKFKVNNVTRKAKKHVESLVNKYANMVISKFN